MQRAKFFAKFDVFNRTFAEAVALRATKCSPMPSDYVACVLLILKLATLLMLDLQRSSLANQWADSMNHERI